MFWLMNGMRPPGGGRTHRGGFRPAGGLWLVPGLLFGGVFGLWAVLAALNVAGVVIGAVFSGLAAAFSGIISGIGAVFSGIASAVSGLLSGMGSAISGIGTAGSVIVGIVIGLVLFYTLRQRKGQQREEE